ncbi:Mical-like 2 [Cichlidogyrus casuarinus]|uniref:Mical-like 2 n=1 Tax=Cichlidogyrus casuarinus TaxID=1844966 RepID=A0ABD2PSI0_9PLAT
MGGKNRGRQRSENAIRRRKSRSEQRYKEMFCNPIAECFKELPFYNVRYPKFMKLLNNTAPAGDREKCKEKQKEELILMSGSEVTLARVDEEEITNNRRPQSVAGKWARPSSGIVCFQCGKNCYIAERIVADDCLFHRNCFRCTQCDSRLTQGSWNRVNSSFLCNLCNKRWLTEYLSNRRPC